MHAAYMPPARLLIVHSQAQTNRHGSLTSLTSDRGVISAAASRANQPMSNYHVLIKASKSETHVDGSLRSDRLGARGDYAVLHFGRVGRERQRKADVHVFGLCK